MSDEELESLSPNLSRVWWGNYIDKIVEVCTWPGLALLLMVTRSAANRVKMPAGFDRIFIVCQSGSSFLFEMEGFTSFTTTWSSSVYSFALPQPFAFNKVFSCFPPSCRMRPSQPLGRCLRLRSDLRHVHPPERRDQTPCSDFLKLAVARDVQNTCLHKLTGPNSVPFTIWSIIVRHGARKHFPLNLLLGSKSITNICWT